MAADEKRCSEIRVTDWYLLETRALLLDLVTDPRVLALLVIDVADDSQRAQALFQWLKENPLQAAVLGVLPPEANDTLQRAAGAVEDFLLVGC